MDATIIESHKKEARMTYEGVPGYQPMPAEWAKTMVVLTDEFRDGNVGAMQEPLPEATAVYAALLETVGEFSFRGDSSCREHRLLDWPRDEQRQDDPRGFIGFSVFRLTLCWNRVRVDGAAAQGVSFQTIKPAGYKSLGLQFSPGILAGNTLYMYREGPDEVKSTIAHLGPG